MSVLILPHFNKIIKLCIYFLILIFPLYLAILLLRFVVTWTLDTLERRDSVPVLELIRGPLKQDDYRILNAIGEYNFLKAPSEKNVPYNLWDPDIDPSMGQASIVLKIFNYMKQGFFVECGALDGETRSNTLALEKNYGWKGLLIEGDPSNYKMMMEKNRKAWTASCCLAIHPYPHEALYQQDFNTGGIKSDHDVDSALTTANQTMIKVQCFPLFSLLSAIGISTVDYFSLDVEGNELEVLKTIPFEQIHIKVLSVEFTHGPGGSASLEEFMTNKNYRMVTKLTHKRSYANDLIFVHNSFPFKAKFPHVIESKKFNK